jgi:SufS family cysteine desulfurase
MTGTTWQGEVLSPAVREDFPFFGTAEGDGLAYLDNAATTQKPAAVLDAVHRYYTTANSNVGRGFYRLSSNSGDLFEAARHTVAQAIGAGRADEVIFTAGTTHAVNLVADTLGPRLVKRGDQVLVTAMEHNSNLLPWLRLCQRAGAELVVAPVGPAGTVPTDAFAALLGPRVRLAAVTQVSNVLGTVNPVRDLVAQAHRHGVPVLVDGAQAVPHRRVDLQDLGADLYCVSAHKMYGPMGVGVLYGRHDLLADLPPFMVGGGTVKGVSLTEQVRYLSGPARWEAGTPNVAGAVGLAAAFDYLDGLGRDRVRAHDEALVRRAVDGLGGLPGVRVIGNPADDPSGIVSFVVDGIHPYDVGGHLDRHGIAARCGVHCASAFLDELGLLGTVRLSFGVYNTAADIDRACDAVATVRPGEWTAEHPTTRFL